MSARPPSRQAPRAQPMEDPRAAPAAKDRRGPLRWMRNLLGHPVRPQQRRDPLHGAIVDPRRDAAPALLAQQRAELAARLLVHDPATQIVRHLFVVHEELRENGWDGIEALPPKVIERALTEAEMLASHEPSELLTTIIDNLRALKVGTDAQATLEPDTQQPQIVEVSETDFDEFELMERSWAGTVPAALKLPDRGL